MVRVEPTPSLFLRGMAGSELPLVVSHGEGRVELSPGVSPESLEARRAPDGSTIEGRVALRFIDHERRPTETLPRQPERLGSGHDRDLAATMGAC